MDTIPDARSGLKGELFLEVLRTFGSARLRVTGTSMLPSIWPGDILEVDRFPFSTFDFRFSIFEPRVSSLDYRLLTVDSRLSTFHCDWIRPGELVLYERAGRFFAHRVVGAYGGTPLLITRGDRLRQPDPPVSPEELVGRVKAILRGGRRIVPRRTWWGRAASWVLCRSDVSTGILLRVRKAVAGTVIPTPLSFPRKREPTG